MLDRLKPKHLAASYRIAKHPRKGAYPFFRDPKAMIALRETAQKEEKTDARTSH